MIHESIILKTLSDNIEFKISYLEEDELSSLKSNGFLMYIKMICEWHCRKCNSI
jgi:hypothetical protein